MDVVDFSGLYGCVCLINSIMLILRGIRITNMFSEVIQVSFQNTHFLKFLRNMPLILLGVAPYLPLILLSFAPFLAPYFSVSASYR